ncbi:MAG: hypothetical protein ACRDGE_09485, partial [Candidatus Limnocylindria bacterium]
RTLRARPLVAVALAVGAGLAAARSARLDVTFERGTFEARALYEAAAWSLVERGETVGAGGIVLAQQRAFPGAPLGEPAHNVLLLALAELGPAGVLAWLVLFAALAALAWRRRHDAALRAGPLVGLAVMLPLLWFDHHLWTQPTGRALLVWTLAALVAASGQTAGTRRNIRPAGRGPSYSSATPSQ